MDNKIGNIGIEFDLAPLEIGEVLSVSTYRELTVQYMQITIVY